MTERRRRPLTPDEDEAWTGLARTVTPLPNRPRPAPPPPAAPRPKMVSTLAPPPAKPAKKKTVAPPQALESLANLDGRNAERLRKGKLPVEAVLDMHGMYQDDAHNALVSFVTRCYAAQRRCVLVVTGKGDGRGKGVLKANLPRWLGEPSLRQCIVAVTPAAPQHGGGGAFYLYLKRKR